MRLQDKVSCIREELRVYLEPTILTICTVPYNMMADQNAKETNERVRNINEIIRQIQQRSVLPMRVLDLARMMEDSLTVHTVVIAQKAHEAHFSRAKTLETADLTGVPQRSIVGPINYRPLKEM